jgi:hypothetical protein
MASDVLKRYQTAREAREAFEGCAPLGTASALAQSAV